MLRFHTVKLYYWFVTLITTPLFFGENSVRASNEIYRIKNEQIDNYEKISKIYFM